MKSVWDVGGRLRIGMWEAVLKRSRGGGMLLKNRCGMREVNEKTSGMWECPSSKQREAGGRSKTSKRSKIVVGGGRREGG